jgi:hypothetical protein
MLSNYLLVAWRTLRNRVGPTAINVVGLAVGGRSTLPEPRTRRPSC